MAPDPPDPPDPIKTASAQADANVQTAIGNSIINNADVHAPTGSTHFDITGWQQITDPEGKKVDVPRWTQTTTLSPEQQTLYDQQVALGQQENTIAGKALDSANNILSTPMTAAPTLQTSYGQGGQIQQDIAPGLLSIAGSLGNYNFDQARDDATNAVLQRLAPSMSRDDESMSAGLANQGLTQGSAAWNAAMQSRNAAKNDLRLGAVQTGDTEQQALFNQLLASKQFQNSAQEQEYEQLAGRAGFHNQAQAQQNQENAAAAQYANQAKLAQLQADMAVREQPLNEIASLRTGGQVTMPQFNGYQGGTIAQTPLSDDVYASANLAEQNYQIESQQSAAMMQGLFGMMGGLFKMSDPRLKRDAVRLGTMPNGLGLYLYRYIWGGPREVGYMADEVAAKRPDAVAVHPSGFLMVDYAKAA